MMSAPGPRLPLVLADSMLSTFLVAIPERCGDDDRSLHPDFQHPAHHHV